MLLPHSEIAKTTERYRNRQTLREEAAGKVPAEADTAERVQKRIARLAIHEARAVAAAVVVTEAATPAPAVRRGLGLERVLQKSDFVDAGFLEQGVRAARAVGRVMLRGAGGRTRGFGTGFLVSRHVLLTNHHVLPAPRDARSSAVEFEYEASNGANGTLFELDPDTLFLTDEALDYTLVAVRPKGTGNGDINRYGCIPLIEEEGKLLKGEAVNIIQHPNGEPKQLALRENRVVDILPEYLHYVTDTAPGSSGSPVFNDQWEVVALHHSGVPEKRDGQILAIDGSVWTESMGEHRIRWIANEGVRISRIARHVKAQRPPSSAARQLRNQIFEAPEHLPAASLTGESRSGPGPVMASDGTVTWTIPLRVSIRLGELPAAVPMGPPSPTAPVTEAPPEDLGDSDEVREALEEARAAETRPYYEVEQDRADAESYYAALDLSQSPQDLFRSLHKLLSSTHARRLSYKPQTRLYPWVDLQPNRALRSIYSRLEFSPEELIREDFRIDLERAARLRERIGGESSLGVERIGMELDQLEAELPYNCEHVVPQSWFNKREPMRGDLHHLFACEVECNSFRGNTPYFDFPDFQEVVRGDCGKSEPARHQFEPAAGKGAVARATLYFLLRYPGEINAIEKEYSEDRLPILLAWHRAEPPGEYERHRNMAIRAAQGNRNPLIDHPEWADKIDFAGGLG